MQVNLDNDHWLVIGKATRDADYKLVGDKQSPKTTFSLAVGKRKDTTTIFANCVAWYKWAEVAKNICKGDDVLVIGHIESREYNGKTYTDIVVDWLEVGGAETARSTSIETSPSGKPYPKTVKFEETAADGELPF